MNKIRIDRITGNHRRIFRSITASVLAAGLLLTTAGCAETQGAAPAESFVEEITETPRQAAEAASDLTVAGEEPAQSAASEASTFNPDDLFEPLLPEEKESPIVVKDKAGKAASDKTASAASSSEEPAVTEELPPPEEVLEVLFLGDSQFAAAREGGTDIPSLFEGDIEWTDCRTYNLGIPGSCICLGYEQYKENSENWDSTCFYAMANILAGKIDPEYLARDYPEVLKALKSFDPERIDYIVISYGVNDFLRSSIIYNEDNPDRTDTVAGAYNRGLLLLKEVFPNAAFVNCTPLYSNFYDRDGAMIGDGLSLKNGQDKNLADYVGCVQASSSTVENSYLINMFTGEYMDLDMYSVDEYLADGIHLTPRGRLAYARVLSGFISRREGIDPHSFEIVKIGEL